METIAYKIENKNIWLEAERAGVYYGSALDEKDGFIHLSTIEQLADTLRLHFNGVKDLVIAQIDLNAIAQDLKWEKSRGGDEFPHLYAPLAMKNVVRCFDAAYDGAVVLVPPDLLKHNNECQNTGGK